MRRCEDCKHSECLMPITPELLTCGYARRGEEWACCTRCCVR